MRQNKEMHTSIFSCSLYIHKLPIYWGAIIHHFRTLN